jgi:hypothetical protein
VKSVLVGCDEVVVTFSEPIERASVETAFTEGASTRPADGDEEATVACHEVTWSDGGDAATCHPDDVLEGHDTLVLDGRVPSFEGAALALLEAHWVVRDAPSNHRTSWLGTPLRTEPSTVARS